MTKIYNLIHLNGQMYMVDKEATIDQDDWIIGYSEVTKANDEWCEDTHDEWKRIIATTDPSLNLPLLPQIEMKIDSDKELERKIVKIIKRVLVKGQKFELAALFRDEERSITESLLTPLPKQVEVEMQLEYAQQQDSDVDIEYFSPKVINNIVQVKRWIYDGS